MQDLRFINKYDVHSKHCMAKSDVFTAPQNGSIAVFAGDYRNAAILCVKNFSGESPCL